MSIPASNLEALKGVDAVKIWLEASRSDSVAKMIAGRELSIHKPSSGKEVIQFVANEVIDEAGKAASSKPVTPADEFNLLNSVVTLVKREKSSFTLDDLKKLNEKVQSHENDEGTLYTLMIDDVANLVKERSSEIESVKDWLKPKSSERVEISENQHVSKPTKMRLTLHKTEKGKIIEFVTKDVIDKARKQSFFRPDYDSNFTDVMKTAVDLIKNDKSNFSNEQLFELQARIDHYGKNHFIFRKSYGKSIIRDVSQLIKERCKFHRKDFLNDRKTTDPKLGGKRLFRGALPFVQQSCEGLINEIDRRNEWNVKIGDAKIGSIKKHSKLSPSEKLEKNKKMARDLILKANDMLGKNISKENLDKKVDMLMDLNNKDSDDLEMFDVFGVNKDNQDLLVLKLLTKDVEPYATNTLNLQLQDIEFNVGNPDSKTLTSTMVKEGSIVFCVTEMDLPIQQNGDTKATIHVKLTAKLDINTGDLDFEVDRSNVTFKKIIPSSDASNLLEALNQPLPTTLSEVGYIDDPVDDLFNKIISKRSDASIIEVLKSRDYSDLTKVQKKDLFSRIVSEVNEDMKISIFSTLVDLAKDNDEKSQELLKSVTSALEEHFFEGISVLNDTKMSALHGVEAIKTIQRKLDSDLFKNLPLSLKTALKITLHSNLDELYHKFSDYFPEVGLDEMRSVFGPNFKTKEVETIKRNELENSRICLEAYTLKLEDKFSDEDVSKIRGVSPIVEDDISQIEKDLMRNNIPLKLGNYKVPLAVITSPEMRSSAMRSRFADILQASDLMMETDHSYDMTINRRNMLLKEKGNAESLQPYQRDGVRNLVNDNRDIIPLKLFTQTTDFYSVQSIADRLVEFNENVDASEQFVTGSCQKTDVEMRYEEGKVIGEVNYVLPLHFYADPKESIASIKVKLIAQIDVESGNTYVEVVFSDLDFEKWLRLGIRQKLVKAINRPIPKRKTKEDEVIDGVIRKYDGKSKLNLQAGSALTYMERLESDDQRSEFLKKMIGGLRKEWRDEAKVTSFVSSMFVKAESDHARLKMLTQSVVTFYGEGNASKLFSKWVPSKG